MQLAVTTPWFASALGLALFGLGATVSALDDAPASRRLVLQAVSEPDALYLSAWRQGDLHLRADATLQPITFYTRATLTDGCRWLGIERLIPLDASTFAYEYSEVILECEAGATPAGKTPRRGLVHVD